jgi:hypothetical protein
MDAHLPGWLWPIAALSGLGAFIDFLIGRVGQDRTRDILASWWIRFDDIKWSNFGQKEASFSVSVLDLVCGKRFLSVKRIYFLIATTATLLIIDILIIPHLVSYYMIVSTPVVISMTSIAISVLAFSLSISYSREISRFVLSIYSDSGWTNLTIIVVFFAVSYIILVAWVPVVRTISDFVELKVVYYLEASHIISRSSTITLLREATFLDYVYIGVRKISLNPKQLVSNYISDFLLPLQDEGLKGQIDIFRLEFTRSSLGYLANFSRLLLSLFFLMFALTKPFLMSPVSLVWRRILESEKPIFTLVLGGIGGIATAGSELLKHL